MICASHQSRLVLPRQCNLWFCKYSLGRTASLVLLTAFVAMAQEREDPGITRQQADNILDELKERLLEGFVNTAKSPSPIGPPSTGSLNVDAGYSLGSKQAPLVLVEFVDYQCRFCGQFEQTTFLELRKKYVDTGKLRLIIRDLPLTTIHPAAIRAAEVAHCAGDQGKFWPMHHALFLDQDKLDLRNRASYAGALKLDANNFQACVESEKHKQDILNDIEAASALQIASTPAFLLGKMSGHVVTGTLFTGAQSFSAIERKIRGSELRR
jgi:protein-disulfide isomerase